jgi:hypothetical protein
MQKSAISKIDGHKPEWLKLRKDELKETIRKFTLLPVLATFIGCGFLLNAQEAAPKINQNIKLFSTFKDDLKLIKVRVKSVKQPGAFDSAVLLNGVTENQVTGNCEWYQGGIINLEGQTFFTYEVWDRKGVSIIPKGNITAIIPFNSTIKPKDELELSLKIGNGYVMIEVKDLDNGAHKEIKFGTLENVFKGGDTKVPTALYSTQFYSTSVFRELWVPENFDIGTLSTQKIKIVAPEDFSNSSLGAERTIYLRSYGSKIKSSENHRTGFSSMDLSDIFFRNVFVGFTSDEFGQKSSFLTFGKNAER